MITLQLPAGRTVQGPVSTQPPPPPAGKLDEEDQPSAPMTDDGHFIPPQQSVETGGESLDKTSAPGTALILRDSPLAPPGGYSSSVNEPNVGSQGDAIFSTHNWYAEISTDGGASYSYISPYAMFPSTPAAFAGGFCCDQRVTQDSSRNLIFWYLQYSNNGATPLTNGVRLAVAHGQAGLAANTWQIHDLTPAQFGLTDKWFDFPHMQASANFLYFTTNIFDGTSGAFYGALVARIPLAELDSNSALTVSSFLTTTFGSIMAVHGAAAEGVRPGRTTMYFASVNTSTSLKVLVWPEASAAPAVHDVTGLASSSFASYVCTGPDGLNPCLRAGARAQTGWITDSELGILWTSAQNGSARPYPYTRVAILDPATLAVIAQPDIFSTTSAWLYPAIAVNERGHLGGVIDNLGGNVLPTIRALFRDDFSPDPVTSGWETIPVATSTHGTSGRWGDYNGVVAHQKYPKTWLGVGHVQTGGSGNASSQTHSFSFGRARDAFPAPAADFYTVAPCRLVDTRMTGLALASGVPRIFTVAGLCGIPADAVSVSINVTAIAPLWSGRITLFPGDGPLPPTSTINFPAGATLANNAILSLAASAAGTLGAQSFLTGGGQVDMTVDVTGYFK